MRRENTAKQDTAVKSSWLESFVIAFSMYSRIPMPQMAWTDAGMKYAMCFFPLVGAVIGAVMWGFSWLAWSLPLGEISRSCLGTVIPLLITGGIHMDGFLDTVDALSSCQPRERKLEILKDPHTGAFAIIGCGVYLLLYLAVFSELGAKAFPAASGIYVLTRSLSGWSVVSLPKARKDGLAASFSQHAQTRAVQAALGICGVIAALWIVLFAGGLVGAVMLLAAIACMFWYCHMVKKEFGGVTGDLAGWFLQVCELAMFGVMALLQRLL